MDRNQPQQALEIIQKFLPLFPGNPELLSLAGVAAYRSDNLRLALEYWKQSLDLKADPAVDAAYRAALRAYLAARKSAGTELLRNRHLLFTPPGAAQLLAGQVDSRLLAMLAAVSSQYQFRVTAFSDAAPGAQVPFRQMTISGGRTADLAALAMVRAQNSPYLPAHAAIVRLDTGQIALSIEFAAPSPLGLLTAVLTAQREGK
jgi:tetratricopeptide (TPR) repeat protein